jgi:hypothetical protein
LSTSQPPGTFYQDYESVEAWARLPWLPWSSQTFLKSQRMLEGTRDELLALTLPAGRTIPTIEAKGCQGTANAFYGIDPDTLGDLDPSKVRLDRVRAVERGLIRPTITICYPLVDSFSWAGRTLIWRSEQQKARPQG